MAARKQYDCVDIEMGQLEQAIDDVLKKHRLLLNQAYEKSEKPVRSRQDTGDLEETKEDPLNNRKPGPPSSVTFLRLQAMYLKQTAEDAEKFQRILDSEKRQFEHNEKEQERLASNIRRVREVLEELGRHGNNTSLEAQWAAIRKLNYEVSTREWVLIRAKKVIFSLCAAAIGFCLGVAMGVTMPAGGIIALPAAIFASLKSAAAALLGASAGAATSIVGPTFFGCMMGRDEANRQTGSQVEAHMVEMRNEFSRQNSETLRIFLAEQFNLLVENYGVHHPACQIISAVLVYSGKLEKSAHGFFETGREGQLKKGRATRLATAQIIQQLLLNKQSHQEPGKQNILEMRVNMGNRNLSYRDVLDMRRHPKRDACFGLFMKKSHTLKIAHAAAEKNHIDLESQNPGLGMF